jgi:predicted AAA+ superfamily ATPase
MYNRILAKKISEAIKSYSVVAVTGPRQSGKTTLIRFLFPEYKYYSFEDPDLRLQVESDPRSFLNQNSEYFIFDEAQRIPSLFSYIQTIVDQPNNKKKFVISGSENLLLSDQISQTLAGRVRIFNLLPLSRQELKISSLHETLLTGGYPRIHNQHLNSTEWLSQYYATYVQKDVRALINVENLDQFDRFVRLVASRVGQLLDYASIGSDCGISQPTAKKWFSILKATFICFHLEPHFHNFGKRLIKSPKSYFYDVGLLCYLLRIKNQNELLTHPLYGNIFENWVISEKIKEKFNNGLESNLYFWRDQKGHEVDLVEETSKGLFPTEIKSSATFHPSFIKNLDYLNGLQNLSEGTCVYGGDENFEFKGYNVMGWQG